MKKSFIISVFVSIALGFIVGNVLYNEYEKNNSDIEFNSYLLQQGIYSSMDEVNNNLSNLDNYTIIEKDDKYYIYLGITTNKDNAEKVQNMFKKNNINVSIKKTVIDNVEFISNLEQYDILLRTAKNKEAIMSINDVILSSYEEMVLNN